MGSLRKFDLQLFAEGGEGLEPGVTGGGGAEPSTGGSQGDPGSTPANQPAAGGADPLKEIRDQLAQFADISEKYESLQQRAQLMEQYLQSLGIDPNMLNQTQQFGQFGQFGFQQPGALGFNPADPYGMGMGQNFEDPAVRQLREQIEELRLQQEMYELSRKYPDFEANKDQIVKLAAELGGVPLEVAYRYWKVDNLPPPPDIEKIKQEAIQEYLEGKRQAAKQPSPQGSGGGVPAGPSKPKNLDEADKMALRRLEQVFRNS